MAAAFPGKDITEPECLKNDSESFTQMSDEVREMYCEDCDKELQTPIKADGFCATCFEYLCSICIRYHKKHLPQHALQDSANMPQDFCFDKCLKHPKEILKFYCNTCETTACPDCKTEKHDHCSEVCHIPMTVQFDKMKDELRQLTLSIDDTLEELVAKRERAASQLTEAYSNKTEVYASIQKHKAALKRQIQDQHKLILDDVEMRQTLEIGKYEQKRAAIIAKLDEGRAELQVRLENERKNTSQHFQSQQNKLFESIDKTEQDLVEKIEKMNQTEIKTLQLVLSTTDTAVREIKEMKSSISSKKKTGQKCKLFVALKQAKSYKQKIEKDIQKNIEVNSYEFQPKNNTINLMFADNEVTFGSFLVKSEVKRTLEEVDVIDRGFIEDGQRTYVTGLSKISDKLVVADSRNTSIKLIDLKRKCQTFSVKLESQPFDLTCVETEQIATTLPTAKKINFLTLTKTGKLSLDHQINVGMKCYGIDYIKPNFIVACQDPGCVKIMSVRGEPKQTLLGFHQPDYVRVNKNTGIFYVLDTKIQANSDSSKFKFIKTITKECCDKKTMILSSYNEQNCLAIDDFGSVYTLEMLKYNTLNKLITVFFNERMNVLQFSANLETVQQIHTKSTCHDISCVFYCKEEGKLYVGADNGKIFIFRLT